MSEQTPSDEDLVRRIASGDREALASLYQQYSSPMLGLAIRILKHRGEAEDVLQDVFVEVWRRAGDYDGRKGSVKSWLFLRLRCRCLDRLKSPRLARRSRLSTTDSNQIKDKDGSAENAAEAHFVRTALAELPANLKSILQLGYFEGLSAREIGERLDMPIGTVKSRTAKAIKELRAILRPKTPGDATT